MSGIFKVKNLQQECTLSVSRPGSQPISIPAGHKDCVQLCLEQNFLSSKFLIDRLKQGFGELVSSVEKAVLSGLLFLKEVLEFHILQLFPKTFQLTLRPALYALQK